MSVIHEGYPVPACGTNLACLVPQERALRVPSVVPTREGHSNRDHSRYGSEFGSTGQALC